MDIRQAEILNRNDMEHTAEVRRVTWIGFFVNIALAGFKFVAGWFGGSQALIADSVHSLSDTGTDVVVLVGVRYWSRPADENHPHGHRRIETLVVTGLGLSLATVAIGMGYNAISTLPLPHNSPPGWIAFGAAVISIFSKELLYRWTAAAGRRARSSAVVANAWHHRSDSLSSVPAALAVLGTRLRPDWAFLDHVGALLVSVFVLQAAWGIARPALSKLSDEAAPEAVRRQIDELARSVSGVHDLHAIRTRYSGCQSLSVDLHVLVDATISVREGHTISANVKHALLNQVPDVVDVVIHIEPYPDEA